MTDERQKRLKEKTPKFLQEMYDFSINNPIRVFFFVLFIFTVIAFASFRYLLWNHEPWGEHYSQLADTFSAISGVSVSLAGSLVAIVLAAWAIRQSEQQQALTEKQQELEYDSRVSELCLATLEVYADLSVALAKLERDAARLYATVKDADQFFGEHARQQQDSEKRSTVEVSDSIDKEIGIVVASLRQLAKSISALIGDPIAKAAWNLSLISESSKKMSITRHYQNISVVSDCNKYWRDEAEFHHEREQMRYQDAVNKNSIEPDDARDQISSQIRDSGKNLNHSEETVWGVDTSSPLALARYIDEMADSLERLSRDELEARMRFAEYSSEVHRVAGYLSKCGSVKDRGGFRVVVSEQLEVDVDEIAIAGWETRKGRANKYWNGHSSDKRSLSSPHHFFQSLGLVANGYPRCHTWYSAPVDKEEVKFRMPHTDPDLWKMPTDVRAKAKAENEAVRIEELDKLWKKYNSDQEEIQSDPVFVNGAALSIVALLEKIPVPEQDADGAATRSFKELLKSVEEEDLTEKGLEKADRMLKQGDILGRFSKYQLDAMDSFRWNANSLLWVFCPDERSIEAECHGTSDEPSAVADAISVVDLEKIALHPS